MAETITPPAISVSMVCKDFNGTQVLRDVSFDVRKGEKICIIGPSGSGKSTLLRCLNWLEQPSSGSISLHGIPIGITSAAGAKHQRMSKKSLAAMRARISMV